MLDRKPNDIDMIQQRAHLLVELKHFEDALRDFERLEHLNVEFDKYDHIYCGMARRGCRDVQGAIDDFTASIALDQTLKYGFLERGRSYFECKKWEESIRDLDVYAALRIVTCLMTLENTLHSEALEPQDMRESILHS